MPVVPYAVMMNSQEENLPHRHGIVAGAGRIGTHSISGKSPVLTFEITPRTLGIWGAQAGGAATVGAANWNARTRAGSTGSSSGVKDGRGIFPPPARNRPPP